MNWKQHTNIVVKFKQIADAVEGNHRGKIETSLVN